ncbi:enoyl-CoA hydratase-related protein [Nocardia vermiculata]|uniref:Enoyl-CoA hydratase n=1 Tax=Nocardia vermiculata TaxID=257274 RepID=A0A846XYP7_9NOCA|nr:enoyl-CoA hydratase-related protein [Nocardia vermiculata]NKY50905.1 enoyl-CoA hydratase [Nocardia vermiculata]
MSTTASESAPESPALIVERRDAVLLIRINRPAARNALNSAVIYGIGEALIAAEADPQVRAIVLTGTGDKAFSAGMDLREFAGGSAPSQGSPQQRTALDAFNRFTAGNTSVPIIGAANATAVGGGLELLLACDMIVTSGAAKFAFPEVKRGMFAAGGGTGVATRIPLGIALELLLTGEPIDADRAYRIGLVNAVTEPERVLDTALALAASVAANAPLGLAASKELARLAVTDGPAAGDRRKHWQEVVFASADAAEGAQAFIERRNPEWQGH